MLTRRRLLARTLAAAGGAIALPTFISPRAWAADTPPSRRIQLAHIGCGRMGRGDLGSLIGFKEARYVAVCDVDRTRRDDARDFVTRYYREHGEGEVACAVHDDYRAVLADPAVDAVVISTPDHWHALPVVAAALAGKHIYVQKPLAMTMAEVRHVKRIVARTGCILQIGSQQRSDFNFRRACELVRNGCIGKVHTVKIGLPSDKAGPALTPQAVPANLDYDFWLGSTHAPADFPYTEERVHSQKDLNARPGWLRVEDFCLGMITGWGSHHLDIAQWGLGAELSGPVRIDARGEFPTEGIWNVHGPYHVEMEYAQGAKVIIDGSILNGVRFEGDQGWIFASRVGQHSRAKDPLDRLPLRAHDKAILKQPLPEGSTLLPPSRNHYGNWLEAIAAKKPPVAPIDQGAHTTAACIAAWIGMKLKRPLTFDPATMTFPGDDAANALCVRPERPQHSLEKLVQERGV